MARYIDADKVMEEIARIGGHNLCEWETIGVKALIDRQPTADVAPRAEVIDEFVKRLLDAFPEPHRGGNLCPAIYYDDYREIIEGLALDMKDEVQK